MSYNDPLKDVQKQLNRASLFYNFEVYDGSVPRKKKIHHFVVKFEAGKENRIVRNVYKEFKCN